MSTLEHPERPAGVPARAPRGDRPWSVWWAFAIAFAALSLGAVAAALAAAINNAVVDLPEHADGGYGVALHGLPPVVSFLSTLTMDLALIGGAVLVAASALGGRVVPAALGLRPARLGLSAALVVLGYVGFLLLAAGWTSALGIEDRENVAVQLGTRDSVFGLVAAGFLVCVVAPVAEELFFRGFVFGGLRRHGLVLAALVSGTAFGLAHVASSPIGFIVPLAALGILLALIYERTGSIYPTMALHVVNNSVAFGVSDGRPLAIPVCLAAGALAVYGLSRLVHVAGPGRAVAAAV